MKNKFFFVIVFLGIFLSLLFFVGKMKNQVFDENSISSSCKIIDIYKSMKGKKTRETLAKIEYYYQGEKYTINRPYYSDTKIDECFEIKFIPNNPTFAEVNFRKKIDCR